MRHGIVILFTFLQQFQARGQAANHTADADSFVDFFVDKLFNRAIKAWRSDSANLESTTLGKQGHLAMSSGSPCIPRGIPCNPRGISSMYPIHDRWQDHHPNGNLVRSRRINAATGTEVAQGASAGSAVSTPSIFIDTDPSLVASRTGGRSEEQLIAIVKDALAYRNGIGLNPDSLASDFKFEGPVVGPLNKDAFVNALSNVDFAAAFPDWKGQFYGFHVDPIEGNQVWYLSRGEGTNNGPFPGPLSATGRRVVNPPQACSMTINDQGLISRYTIGYVVDRMAGNTGGLGGLYGILYAIGRGLPFPEAQPWSPSLPYQAFQNMGQLIGGLIPK